MARADQRQCDRDGLQAYIHRVAQVRRLVHLGEVDPSLPTHHGPGSDAKMVLMTIRDEMGLPLNVEGDSGDCGHVPSHPEPETTKTLTHEFVPGPMIRRLMISVPRMTNTRAA